MRRPATTLVLATLGGCAATPPMTATQLDALQVREVQAPADRTFAAATSAVIDAGFTIEVTDGEAGLLTAVRRADPSIAEHAAIFTLTAAITVLTGVGCVTFAHSHLYAIGIQVYPKTEDLSAVRIRPYGHGDLEADRQEIRQLWTLMQRQVLVKDPPG